MDGDLPIWSPKEDLNKDYTSKNVNKDQDSSR